MLLVMQLKVLKLYERLLLLLLLHLLIGFCILSNVPVQLSRQRFGGNLSNLLLHHL